MPRLTLPIMNEYPAITRRVAMQLLKTVLQHLGVKEDVYLSFKGENNPNLVWGSETKRFRRLDEAIDSDRFAHGSKVELEMREEYSDSGYNRNILNDVQYPPIWCEPKLGIWLRPHYIGKNLELNLTYKTRTPEEAGAFLSQLTTLLAINRASLPVDLSYYIIPDQSFIKILGHLHLLQENNAGYGISFDDWMEQHADMSSFRNLRKQDGENSAYGFKEVQCEIYAQLEIQSLPEKSRRDGNPGNEINMTVKIHYEKPYSVTLRYPVSVHNQMIDKRLMIQPEVMTSQKKPYRMDLMGSAMAEVRNLYIDGSFSYSQETGLTVPLGDDWIPPSAIHPYSVCFTGLVPISQEADEQGYRAIGKLDAYAKYLVLSPSLQDYLREVKREVFLTKCCPILVEAWVGEHRISPTQLKIDEELYIYTKKTLTQRDTLHLTISVPRQLTTMPGTFFQSLTNHPGLAEELLRQYCGVLIIPRASVFLANTKRQWLQNPSYQHHGQTFEEYLGRQAERQFYQQLPLVQKGIWHRLVLHVLFGTTLPKRYMKYKDYLLVLTKEGIEKARSVDEIQDFLEMHRYTVFDYYRNDFLDKDTAEVKRAFFGAYDLKKLTYQLTYGGKSNTLGDNQWVKGWGNRTQAGNHLTLLVSQAGGQP